MTDQSRTRPPADLVRAVHALLPLPNDAAEAVAWMSQARRLVARHRGRSHRMTEITGTPDGSLGRPRRSSRSCSTPADQLAGFRRSIHRLRRSGNHRAYLDGNSLGRPLRATARSDQQLCRRNLGKTAHPCLGRGLDG